MCYNPDYDIIVSLVISNQCTINLNHFQTMTKYILDGVRKLQGTCQKWWIMCKRLNFIRKVIKFISLQHMCTLKNQAAEYVVVFALTLVYVHFCLDVVCICRWHLLCGLYFSVVNWNTFWTVVALLTSCKANWAMDMLADTVYNYYGNKKLRRFPVRLFDMEIDFNSALLWRYIHFWHYTCISIKI